jgi:hypothetical protein
MREEALEEPWSRIHLEDEVDTELFLAVHARGVSGLGKDPPAEAVPTDAEGTPGALDYTRVIVDGDGVDAYRAFFMDHRSEMSVFGIRRVKILIYFFIPLISLT